MTKDNDIDKDIDIDAELRSALVTPDMDINAAVKTRLMISLASVNRFDRFIDRIASATDLVKEKADALLRSLDDASRWIGGAESSLFHVDGGPLVANAIVGFVRLQAGQAFPLHEHMGEETMIILQGGMITAEGTKHRAGDEVRMAAGSSHTFTALPGPDLMYLGVIQGGMKIDGNVVLPADPSY